MNEGNSSSDEELFSPKARKSPSSRISSTLRKKSADSLGPPPSPTSSDPRAALESRLSTYLNTSINQMLALFVSDLRSILDTNHRLNSVLDSFQNDLLSNLKSLLRFPEERTYSAIDIDVFPFSKEFRKAESGIRRLKDRSFSPNLDSSLDTLRTTYQNIAGVSLPASPIPTTSPPVRAYSRKKELYELEQKRILIDGRFEAMRKQRQWLDEEIKHLQTIRKMREETHEDTDDIQASVTDLKRNAKDLKQTLQDGMRWREHDDMSTVCDNLYSAAVDMCDGFVGAYQMRVHQRRENRMAQLRQEREALDLAQARQVRSAVFA